MRQKDMGLSESFRLMVSFGREFEAHEVLDSIPYTSYRVLILKMNELKQRGIYKKEKNTSDPHQGTLGP